MHWQFMVGQFIIRCGMDVVESTCVYALVIRQRKMKHKKTGQQLPGSALAHNSYLHEQSFWPTIHMQVGCGVWSIQSASYMCLYSHFLMVLTYATNPLTN